MLEVLTRTCKSRQKISLLLLLLACGVGCRDGEHASIAVIPRTSGTILWEPENVGAQRAAAELGERVYWNASTREDDVDGQIALVDKIRASRYRGLILAPDHSQALITPVRRALASGLPIVIVGSPIPIPPGENLAYVLNDEQAGGRMAARRAAALMHSRGDLALIGIDTDIAGIVERAQSFEQCLARDFPLVHISVRRMGTFNFGHEQEAVEEMLRTNPELKVIVALTAPSTRGAISDNPNRPGSRDVKVIGFDPESLPFENPSLDSVIVQNTLGMGDQAVRLIHARFLGQTLPARVMLEPLLVTRENASSREVQEMLYARWRPGEADLRRITEPQ